MATIAERADSRRLATGQNPRVEFRYNVFDTDSEAVARQLVEATAPLTYDLYGNGAILLVREIVNVEERDGFWECTAPLSLGVAADQSTFSFDFTGATQRIVRSLSTEWYGLPGATAPEAGTLGAINASRDGVEGVDITIPSYVWQETFSFLPLAVTGAYKQKLFRLTGKVNQASFRDFLPGEVLFLGATGSKRGTSNWEITFRFSASENKTGITIGDITGIDKEGWQYLETKFKKYVDETAHVMREVPIEVLVHTVYEDGDFDDMEIGA